MEIFDLCTITINRLRRINCYHQYTVGAAAAAAAAAATVTRCVKTVSSFITFGDHLAYLILSQLLLMLLLLLLLLLLMLSLLVESVP